MEVRIQLAMGQRMRVSLSISSSRLKSIRITFVNKRRNREGPA
jgi:hypothetical protein